MNYRTFTPAEANRTLPLVKAIVGDILSKGQELRRELELDKRADEERVEALHREIEGHMAELEAIGCLYKGWGFESGLVDFPGFIDGELVYLCWQVGEQDVTWYHRVEAGYRGRTHIPAEYLAAEAESD